MKNIIFIAALSFLLAACDQRSTKPAEAEKSPQTAVSVNLEVLDLARQGKQIEALKRGEDFLQTGSDPEGALHATMARLYADLGDTESSLLHLQKTNGTTGSANMTVIISREQPPANQPAPAKSPAVSAEVGGAGTAAAVIGPNGIEVRAGDAKASVRH